jgi:hypothetical protein
MSKTTTMKALVEAVQDSASTDAEAVAVLTHMLSARGLVLAARGRTSQVSKSFF